MARKLSKVKVLLAVVAFAGLPLVTTVSCSPRYGTLSVFRDDDYHDDFGFFDLFIQDDYYSDCCYDDYYYEEVVIYP